jgi:hypothetical protein
MILPKLRVTVNVFLDRIRKAVLTRFGAGYACTKARVDCENVCLRPSRDAALKALDCLKQTAFS